MRNNYELEKGLENKTVIIHGFGTMGQNVATFLSSKGVKIVGVQEWDGCVYNPDGVNIKSLKKHFNKFKNV